MSYGMTDDEIAALKVDDRVGVGGRGGWHPETLIVTVTRRTKTQLLTSCGTRWNKHGYSLGGGAYSRKHLIRLVDALQQIAEQRADRKHRNLVRKFCDYGWGALTTEQLEQVDALLVQFAPKDPA